VVSGNSLRGASTGNGISRQRCFSSNIYGGIDQKPKKLAHCGERAKIGAASSDRASKQMLSFPLRFKLANSSILYGDLPYLNI